MAADPSFVVGIIGNVISILVFASPIKTFRRIVRNRSTEDFRWLPYVTTLLSTSLWTFYGLLKPASEEADEEEGLAHLMGQVEMAQRRVRLHKGLSLPKPTGAPLSSPRNGFGSSIIKSLSATPVELQSVMHQHGHGRFEPVKKHDDAEANE